MEDLTSVKKSFLEIEKTVMQDSRQRVKLVQREFAAIMK